MKYLSKLLSMLLVGAMLYSTGCTDYAEDIKNVDNRVDQEVATLTEALQKAIKEAQDANAALQTEIDALETQLAGVETELTGVMSDLDQAKKDLADLQSKAATKEELATLESKVATKTQLAEDLAKLQTDLESKIGGVEARVKANEDAIATLQSFVTGFNGDLKTAGYEKFADVLAALNTLKANYEQHLEAFENYKTEAAEALAMAVADLKTAYKAAINDLKAELEKKIADGDALLQGKIDELVEEKLDPAIEDITALKTDMTNVKGRLEGAEKSIESHAGLIATAQKDIEDLKTKIGTLDKKIDDTKTELQTALNGAVALLEAADKELQRQIDVTKADLDTLTKKVDTLRTDFDEFKEVVEAELDALTENVKRLLNRIQSVVYVPEYTDGKITVKNVTFGNGNGISMVLCGYAKIQYDIYPAYAAEALATSYEEGMLSFNHEALDIRETRAADAFKILAVNYKENGRVELEVLIPNELAKNNVAVSLVVNAPEGDETAAANLSSCYAQLYTTDDVAYNVSMNLYDAKTNEINDEEYKMDMPYDSKDFIAEGGYSYRPFEGYTLGFVLSNDTNRVWSHKDLQAIYPELPMPDYTGDHADSITFAHVDGKDFDPTGLKGIEVVENEPGINVSKNDKQYIGVSSTFGISYNWNGYEVAANAIFTIVKGSSYNVIYKLNEPFEFKWNYGLDAVVDAARIDREGYNDKTYTRNDLKINVAELAKDSDTELPVDVKLAEVLAFAPDSVDVNGVEVSSLADGQLTFNFDGFEWGKEYTVSANYGLNHVDATFGDAIVTVQFYVKTVDRIRDVIKFTYEPVSDVYRTNLVETYTDVISFADYKENFPGINADEFALDVLVNDKRPYDVTSNTVNDVAATDTTMIEIVNDKNINVKYNCDDVDITVKDGLVVRDLAYSKKITLWYGQEVEFIKNVTFNEPTYWFKRVPNYVYDVRNESGIVVGYATDVQPNYTPDSKPTTALGAFDVNAVDLDAAFDLMDSKFNLMTVPVVNENRGVVVAANGDVLKPVFRLTDVQDAGITIADNLISYYGADKFVNVDANIHLCNDNGSVMILGTNFDGPFADVEDYSAYIVNQYDPIGDITSTNHVEPVIEWGDYTVDLTNLFSMKDRRGVEMINQGRAYGQRYLVEGREFPMGGNNGFKKGLYAGDVYGHYVNGELKPVEVTFTYGGSDAAQLENKGLLEYMPSGKIVFHYNSENDLKRDIKINVVMKVTTAWGVHTKGATVTFTKSAYTAE